jgi:hypothetical protein
MGQNVAGTAYVKVDGSQLTITGGAEAPLMEVKRETVYPGYFKEEELAPYLKMTTIFEAGFPLKTLINGRDMTVTCELKNGRVYVLSGAYLVDEPSYKGDDGTVELEFNGIKGSWQ